MTSAAWLQENAALIWNATGGALIVLFLSIVSQSRRSWKQLTVGCLFGALGSSFVGWAFAEEWWVYPACGAAAIMTENLALGIMNLSAKFRDDPVDIVTHFIKLFLPAFGKPVGYTDYKDEVARDRAEHGPGDYLDPSYGGDGPEHDPHYRGEPPYRRGPPYG